MEIAASHHTLAERDTTSMANIQRKGFTATQIVGFTPGHFANAVSRRRPDSLQWTEEIKRDFAVLRAHHTFENITTVKPQGKVFRMGQVYNTKSGKLQGDENDLQSLPECQ